MKKILLSTLVLLAAVTALAQDKTPTITLTAEVGKTLELGFANATTAGTLQIDWGDGTLVTTSEVNVYDGWTKLSVKGTPLQDGTVKIYDTAGDLSVFDAGYNASYGNKVSTLDVSGATNLTYLSVPTQSLTTLDLSKNTKLTKVELTGNQIASIDLSACTELATLDLSNNKLSAIDLSKNTKISTLNLGKNLFKSIDLSANTALKTLRIATGELESINLGDNTTLNYISVNSNKLTSLDLSKQTGLANKATVLAQDNNLTELLFPDVTVRTVNVSGNKFTLATLPTYFSKVTTLTYAPQQDYEIAKVTGLNTNKTIDLSSQATVGENATTYTVYAGENTLTEGTDYTISGGVITFLTAQTDSVYVAMSNDAYPKFTGSSIFKTTKTAVKTVDPTITLTAEVDGNTRSFTFSMATTASKLQIDWGDGTLVETEEIPVNDGYTDKDVTGTPVGNGEIKIYGAEDLKTFEAISRVDSKKITMIDVSKATELTELYVNTNSLTGIDLSNNKKLTKLYLATNLLAAVDLSQNTELTYLTLNDNQLTNIDLSNNTKIATLYLNNNQIKQADFSANTALKSLYFLNNGLENLELGDNTTLNYISVNYNKLTTLDLSRQTGLGTKGKIFAIGNNLQDIVLPDVTVPAVNISSNKFTLATLPYLSNKVTTLTYAPQQDYEVASEMKVNDVLDLSSQATVSGKATVYAVVKSDGTALTEGTDYSVADGKITMLTAQSDAVHVTMSNEAYPKFTGSNIFKTTTFTVASATAIDGVDAADTTAPAEYFTLDGKRVKAAQGKGVYIVRQGKTARKVVVK